MADLDKTEQTKFESAEIEISLNIKINASASKI